MTGYMHSFSEYGETSLQEQELLPVLVLMCNHTSPTHRIGGARSDFVSQIQRWHSINRKLMNRTILFLGDGLFMRLSLQPLWRKIAFGKS